MFRHCLLALLLAVMATEAAAQSTVFTYQGRLQVGGDALNSAVDLEFSLLDGAEQLIDVQVVEDVAVLDGVFAVALDFGAVFDGSARSLQIAVRAADDTGPFLVLSPLQPMNSTTQALFAQQTAFADLALVAEDAAALGGRPAADYVAGDTTLFVRNQTTVQDGAGFNVGGDGTVGGTLTARGILVQGGVRARGGPPGAFGNFNNGYAFAGNGGDTDSGLFSLGDGQVSLYTDSQDRLRVTGSAASFTVPLASTGAINTGSEYRINGQRVLAVNGNLNLFAGVDAGTANIGQQNTMLGARAGAGNTSGVRNTFVGDAAGNANITARESTFVGALAGLVSTGDRNTFVGAGSGQTNTTGSDNTAIGMLANVGAGLQFATAVGAQSSVGSSNTVALGRASGSDRVVVYGLGTAGSVTLCRNSLAQLAQCASSMRYKRNAVPFESGMEVVRALEPIRFEWIDGGMQDVGFSAEAVAEIEPLLVSHNTEGAVEGVRYDRMAVLFVNALKAQQAQIESQQARLEALEALLCELHPAHVACTP